MTTYTLPTALNGGVCDVELFLDPNTSRRSARKRGLSGAGIRENIFGTVQVRNLQRREDLAHTERNFAIRRLVHLPCVS